MSEAPTEAELKSARIVTKMGIVERLRDRAEGAFAQGRWIAGKTGESPEAKLTDEGDKAGAPDGYYDEEYEFEEAEQTEGEALPEVPEGFEISDLALSRDASLALVWLKAATWHPYDLDEQTQCLGGASRDMKDAAEIIASLLAALEDATATLDNVLLHHGMQMTPADRTARQVVLERARAAIATAEGRA